MSLKEIKGWMIPWKHIPSLRALFLWKRAVNLDRVMLLRWCIKRNVTAYDTSSLLLMNPLATFSWRGSQKESARLLLTRTISLSTRTTPYSRPFYSSPYLSPTRGSWSFSWMAMITLRGNEISTKEHRFGALNPISMIRCDRLFSTGNKRYFKNIIYIISNILLFVLNLWRDFRH